MEQQTVVNHTLARL